MTTAGVQPSVADMEHAHHVVNAISLTGGHILLESVPGLAKTTAARVVADSISGGFQRIQRNHRSPTAT